MSFNDENQDKDSNKKTNHQKTRERKVCILAVEGREGCYTVDCVLT